MSTLALDKIPESKRIGGHINIASSAGLITDTLVNDNATVTLLKAALLTACVRTEQKPLVIKLNKALDRGIALSLISETHGVTTVAGLLALTDAASTFKQGFFQ